MEDKVVVINGVEYVLYVNFVEAVRNADVSGFDAGYDQGWSDKIDYVSEVGSDDAKLAEREAYDDGYGAGYEEGYNEGYSDGVDQRE